MTDCKKYASLNEKKVFDEVNSCTTKTESEKVINKLLSKNYNSSSCCSGLGFSSVWELPTRTRKQNVFHASVRMRSGPNPAYQSTFSMISYTTIQGHFKFNLYESNPASVRYDSLSR